MYKTLGRLTKLLPLIALVVTPLLPASVSADNSFSGFTIPDYDFPNLGMASGPDGALWYTYLPLNSPDGDNNPGIERITTSGSVTRYPVNQPSAQTGSITAGPDGAMWFTLTPATVNNVYLGAIGRITTSGSMRLFSIPLPAGARSNITSPRDIITGPDGALWFTDIANNMVDRITTDGDISYYQVPVTGQYNSIRNITVGSDGALWFTVNGESIGRITTDGNITTFNDPNAYEYLTSGPDGAIWFSTLNNKIGRITTAGVISEFTNTVPGSFNPQALTTGPDGQIWFDTQGETSGDGYMVSMNTSGVVTSSMEMEYEENTMAPAYPGTITTGADGALWFPVDTSSFTPQVGFIGRLQIASAPSAPADLNVQSPAQNPQLTWTAASGATYYNIYRNSSLIDTISAANTSYTDNTAPEGANTYYVTAQNEAGTSDPSSNVSVLVDRTNPTISYTVTPLADSDGYNTGEVTVTFNCDDNAGGSGIASCTGPVTVDDEGIGQTVDGTVTDNAGNTTTIHANASILNQSVNAGGTASGSYSADTGFAGGATYTSVPDDLDTSNVLNAAPRDVYESDRYGSNFSYTFSGLTANADYTLKLHFNEPYWGVGGNGGGAGSRVFNVTANGQPALSNYDVFRAGGGSNSAIAEQVPVTADADGKVTVQFSAVTDTAIVSGLQLFNGTLPSQAPDAEYGFPTIINAGGFTTQRFFADADFSGGTTYTSSAHVDTSNITNPVPQAVYQSTRYGSGFSYTFATLAPNTSYHVRLDFNEPYWGTASVGGGVGSRVFNVAINDTSVLNNFDIFATAGGANIALARDFTATSDASGKITINFTSVTDNAIVSGIEVTHS